MRRFAQLWWVIAAVLYLAAWVWVALRFAGAMP